MGKPSIFSREYEKKMRKRRRNMMIVSLITILIISVLIIKVVYNPIDFTNVKNNIQAWIDSDSNNVEVPAEKIKEEIVDEEPIKEEELQKPLEESMDIALVSGNMAKAIYTEDNNVGRVFKTLETSDKGVSFDISPLGKQIIVTDTNAVITLYNVDGTSKIVSKDQYVSSSGSAFTKEATMQSNPQYLWNVNTKFISEAKIIFVTNRPYFGNSDLNQYLWMTDIPNNADKVFWELAGSNIEIGIKEEKGIKVTVDGNSYYMDADGNYIK